MGCLSVLIWHVKTGSLARNAGEAHTGRVSAAQLCSVVMASTQTEVPMRSPAATISRTRAATPTDARDW